MSYNVPDHFSYNYKIDLDKLPAKQADRIAPSLLLPGILAGLFLIVLGCYELMLGVRPEDNPQLAAIIDPWVNLTLFDIVIISLGIWIIISLLLSYFQYKKIFIDAKKATLIYRLPWGTKVIKESLKKYLGVRFRVEFFQFGFMNKSKYIIELYHKDNDKVAPLYISTSGHNIRKIWNDYARKLRLPQIIMTDEGLQKRNNSDIGKPLTQMYADGLIKNDFNFNTPLPNSIIWVKKKDKSVIKSKKIRWDIYNVLVGLAVVTACLLVLFNIPAIVQSLPATVFGLFLVAFVTSLVLKFCTKDKLVIKPHKLVIVHKTFRFSRKKYEILKKDIEAIDIAFNPVYERYFLAIIGSEKTLVFGKKLPLSDLQWIRAFLIHDIVKK